MSSRTHAIRRTISSPSANLEDQIEDLPVFNVTQESDLKTVALAVRVASVWRERGLRKNSSRGMLPPRPPAAVPEE